MIITPKDISKHADKPTFVDYSGLACCARCPLRYFFKYCCHLRTPPSSALPFGTGIHAAIPYARIGAYADAMKEFNKCYNIDDYPDEKKRTPSIAEATLRSYHRFYKNNFWETVPPSNKGIIVTDKVSDDETAFGIDIGYELPYVGRTDANCKHKISGDLGIREYKTSGYITNNLLESQEFSPQGLGYSFAQISLGIPVQWVVWEFLQITKTRHEIFQIPVLLNETKLKMWLDWARHYTELILTYWQNKNWPQDLTGCNSYSGFSMASYTCEYKPLCLVGENWPNAVDLFEISTWKPFEVDENETNKTST